MAKPWAKYEVGFINHAKFRALPSNAICLWIEGKDYADDNLTDGLLPTYVVRGFRHFSKRNMELLMTSAGLKSMGGAEAWAPLWEPHPIGIKMHDYLDHNDCRELVVAHRAIKSGTATVDQQRMAAAERQRRKRERDRRVTA